jgi:hypothetical protein
VTSRKNLNKWNVTFLLIFEAITMSIEREFLKKLRYASLLENDLRKELEELLAQPEQTEQEPFDWETKKKSYLDEIDRLGMEANKDQEEIDRLTDLLFSKPATYIGKTQWMQVPEPLSEKDICQILIKKEWKGFVDLVRIIEKAHGIGEDDE